MLCWTLVGASLKPMASKITPIIDDFTLSRGDPQLLEILCNKCKNSLLIYQKDGPGFLMRSYLDRIHTSEIDLEKYKADSKSPIVQCPYCCYKLGCLDVYEKENRPAIFWFVECIKSIDCK